MATYKNELLRKVGRNMMKVQCQRAASVPKMNMNYGASDGGKIGRPKSGWVNGKEGS